MAVFPVVTLRLGKFHVRTETLLQFLIRKAPIGVQKNLLEVHI